MVDILLEGERRKGWKPVKRRLDHKFIAKVKPTVKACTIEGIESKLNGLLDPHKRTPAPFNTI